jgi:hypothetical protein
MKMRKKMKRSRSKKLFSRTAAKTKKRNYAGKPMRGGIRL